MLESEPSCTYEITIVTRNGKGEAIGKKTFASNSAGELCRWYERNAFRNTKKRKKKKVKKDG